MPEKQFISTYTNDPSYHRKVVCTVQMLLPGSIWLQIIGIIYFLSRSLNADYYSHSVYVVLSLLVLIIVSSHFSQQAQYRRAVMNNANQIPKVEVRVSATGIEWLESPSGTHALILLSNVRRIGESEKFVQLLLDHKEIISIDKATLTGGTVEELKAFLLEYCPNLRRKKKIVAARGHQIRRVLLILSVILCLAVTISFSIITKPQRGMIDAMISQYLPYQTEEAEPRQLSTEVLLELDFDPIADEIFEQAKKESEIYPDDNPFSILLATLGTGNYGYDAESNYTWFPLTDDLYRLSIYDGEMDVYAGAGESAYLNLLRGITHVCSEELSITDIRLEKQIRCGFAGLYVSTVSFKLNGEPHELTGKTVSPWIDLYFLNDLAALIRENGGDKQLYFGATDFSRNILVFYRDDAWAKRFEQETGIPLITEF